MENSDRQPSVQSSRGSKVIHIQTCKECKNHRSSTWHDEAKYEANYAQVKSAIEADNPEVTVERKVDGPFILGGFEIMHGKKVLFSKKTSGLWPNPQAVAQRVQLYFNDLDCGRDVSLYGTQREKAYSPQKKPRLGSAYSTGTGDLNAFNSKYGQTGEGFISPEKEKEKQHNNDLHSSPETGYRETEEKNDEVHHKEEKPDHHDHEEHVTSTANQHQQDHHEEKHEHEKEAPSSPVKQEAPHQDHHEAGEHVEPKSAEPQSATSNAQQEGQTHPASENKEESAGLPQNKSEVQEAHHDENKAENPPVQEHKEEATQEKVKAEEEYPEDFAGN
jgi:predicted Rdx family selenoprotein